MNINTEFLTRCIRTLEMALEQLQQYDVDDISYDIRNDTAHQYGEGFAETTLKLLPRFIADAKELARVITEGSHA